MKKTSILLTLIASGFMAVAQSPRLALFEEFTGENCPPCASTNPGLQVVLDANTSKATSIKWEVPIPSAPTATWSLYQTNKTEIDWRYRSTAAGGYGYPSQNTATATIVSGINSAPSGRIDGQHQWTFGAASDHPANLNATALTNAQAVSSPFAVTLTRAWNPTFTAITVTVSITASQTFSVSGALVFRLVMVEQEIHYASAPGTNGEKDFFNAARGSFPNLQSGTSLPTSWTMGQNQTFTVNCNLPANIVDKSMVNMIGFIQADATRMVYQSAKTTTVGIPNDANVTSIAGTAFVCAPSYSPVVVIKNSGSTTITTMTINPALNSVAQTPYNWVGNLVAGASTTINMPAVSAAGGTNTYSVNVVNVSGGDPNTANNTKTSTFVLYSTFANPPVVEAYTAATFPPTNWLLMNPNGGANTWSRSSTVGGFGTGVGSARYDFYNNSVTGDADDLQLPAISLASATGPQLTFDVAYCQYTNETDKLEVKISTNCGQSWATLYNKSGATLSTAAAQTAGFVPTAAQWRTETVNLSSYAGQSQVLLKFVATSDYGNYLYVDNVNLSTSAGIKSLDNFSAIELYPNPAQNETNVRITAANTGEATINVTNALGQNVMSTTASLLVGENNIALDTKELAAGVYNVVIESSEGSSIKKLTISK
jgi:hypothetical protein